MIWQLIYRTTNMLRWGAGTGTNLPAEDIDKNFADLEERTWTIENNPPVGNGIANITQSGDSQLTVWLDDGSSFLFTLPTATFRFLDGGWTPATGLFANDIFVYERAGLYQVIRDHVTAGEFDPAAEDTDGPFYRTLIELFSGSAVKTVATSSYIPVLLDANRYIRCTHGTVCEVTIPTDADVPFAINTELHFRQAAAGTVVIVGDAGVTINPSRPDFTTETPWQGASCGVKKIATNEWDYFGPGTESTV